MRLGFVSQGLRGLTARLSGQAFRKRRMTASMDRDASAKLSAYPAIGCLSPRVVHAALTEHRQRAAGGGTGSSCARRGDAAAARSAGGTAHVEEGAGAGKQSGPGSSSSGPAPRSSDSAVGGGKREGRESQGFAGPRNRAGPDVVGAGAEPGPAPDAEGGAATLAMHLQIRRGQTSTSVWQSLVAAAAPGTFACFLK